MYKSIDVLRMPIMYKSIDIFRMPIMYNGNSYSESN